jgi:hypothetical protein
LMQISKPIQSANVRGPPSFSCYVNAGNRKAFSFQMTYPEPEFRPCIVFPLTPPTPASSKVNVALSIPTHSESVFRFWADVDTRMIKHLAEHSKEFLKKQMTEDEVRTIYIPCIRAKPDYDAYLKVRFDTNPDTRIPFTCLDVNIAAKRYSKLHYSRLEQGDSVLAIVQPGMLYNFSGKVGCTVDCTYLLRYAPPPANNFPFRLGAGMEGFHEVVPEDLFSTEDAAEIDQLVKCREDTMLQSTKTEAPPAVAAETSEDGSTITLDPVTLLPVVMGGATHPSDKDESEDGEPSETERSSKRARI